MIFFYLRQENKREIRNQRTYVRTFRCIRTTYKLQSITAGCVCVCVFFFTLYLPFDPSTSSTPSGRADPPSYKMRDVIQALRSRNDHVSAETTHCNAVEYTIQLHAIVLDTYVNIPRTSVTQRMR